MDIKNLLAKEHSRSATDRIVKFIGNDPSKFGNLVNVFIDGPYRITQRAAWPLSVCLEHYPDLIKPHFNSILNQAMKPGAHDAVKRNVLRTLQFIEIPSKHKGKITRLCFEYLQNRKEPVAIKVFAMTVLSNVAKDYPELADELKLLIHDQLPYASPAFLSRARKVLKMLNNK